MSFRLKTILGIAVIEITLLAILVFSGLSYLRQSSEVELLTRGEVTAQLFATMTSDAVLAFDLATLDALVEQTLLNPGIEYVRVRRDDGAVLSQGGDAEALAAPFVADTSIKTASSDGRLDVHSPIVAAGTTFGYVEIGLSTDRLQLAIAEARQWMLTIAGTEIIFVAIFGVILGTVLTRQLARLREAAKRVAAGEFGHELEVHGNDELADTTVSFNRMSAALSAFAQEAKAARERAEAGREYAETVLNDALNSMPQSVLIVDPDHNISFANDSFRQRYPEAISDTSDVYTFSEIAAAVTPAKIHQNGEETTFTLNDRMSRLASPEKHREWRASTGDGRTMMTTQERMSDGGVVVVEHDITDLFAALERNRQLEMELMQTQKLESLGTMAGGIAHEINTPIQFVGDNLNFLDGAFADISEFLSGITSGDSSLPQNLEKNLDDLDWDFLAEETPNALQEARAGISNVRDIVRSIKEFAHPDSDVKSLHDLADVIENTITVSRNQWRHIAQVKCDIGPGVDAVPCFAGKLSQVLINLIVNAAQAIEEHNGGELGTITINAKNDGENAVISVADDGPGIPPEIIDRIFDMFFTTKAPGKGTGQGLPICKRIIETTHGGEMTVNSARDQGTTFSIHLPLEQTAAAA